MPNGRKGDNPLTDILNFGSAARYPEDVSTLVKEMGRLPSFRSVMDRVEHLLWDVWPHQKLVKPDFAKLRSELLIIRAELEEGGGDPPTV